jgi:hypothetical protein
MREVSVRMLHFCRDLARASGVDERALVAGLTSVVPVAGKEPDWIDWDDFVEVIERFERMAGGPEGVGRAMRAALPSAYPELRAFASVFVLPIPAFRFVMTRLMGTNYRNIAVETIEDLGDDRVRRPSPSRIAPRRRSIVERSRWWSCSRGTSISPRRVSSV